MNKGGEMGSRAKHQPKEALVAYVVKSFDKATDNYLGRTAMQKICYFAQTLGVPMHLDFQVHHYGPFSETLWHMLDDFVVDDILRDRSVEPERYSNYGPGPQLDEVIAEQAETVARYATTIDEVVQALKDLEPKKLELLATVHYVARSLRTAIGKPPGKTEVIQKFRSLKGKKFDTSQIEGVCDILARSKLIA